MGISDLEFLPDQEVDEEEVKRNSKEKQAKYKTRYAPKEAGIEELEFEEAIPGGAALGMLSPGYATKKGTKTALERLRKAGFDHDMRTDIGVDKLAEKMVGGASNKNRLIEKWKHLIFDRPVSKDSRLEKQVDAEIEELLHVAKHKHGLSQDDLDRLAYKQLDKTKK
jgi:hypothetical protein